jgi:glucose/arabinose dehydrogenase
MRKICPIIVALCLVLPVTNCKKDTREEDASETVKPREIAITPVVPNLSIPWGMAFLPDGNLLFCERGGRISLYNNADGSVTPINSRNVNATGEAGLLGIAIDPLFATNHYVYLYENFDSNRVYRMKLENKILTEDKLIVGGIPTAQNHDGGALKFGPDGYLYIGTGDALKPNMAQDKKSLSGKILRVDRDGNIPPGNPFNSRIWSYGHRNVQGFSWTASGVMLATEHGPSIEFGWCCHDEINLIEPGKNYGWPLALAGTETDSLTPPLIQSGMDTWAPSGCTYLGKASIWPNVLLVATLRGQRLIRFYLAGDGRSFVSASDTLADTYKRLRNVVEASDGTIYFGTSNAGSNNPATDGIDKIYRITAK